MLAVQSGTGTGAGTGTGTGTGPVPVSVTPRVGRCPGGCAARYRRGPERDRTGIVHVDLARYATRDNVLG